MDSLGTLFFFVEQDFDQNFWVNCSWFFAFLSGLLGLIHAHSMKDIIFQYKLDDKVVVDR